MPLSKWNTVFNMFNLLASINIHIWCLIFFRTPKSFAPIGWHANTPIFLKGNVTSVERSHSLAIRRIAEIRSRYSNSLATLHTRHSEWVSYDSYNTSDQYDLPAWPTLSAIKRVLSFSIFLRCTLRYKSTPATSPASKWSKAYEEQENFRYEFHRRIALKLTQATGYSPPDTTRVGGRDFQKRSQKGENLFWRI